MSRLKNPWGFWNEEHDHDQGSIHGDTHENEDPDTSSALKSKKVTDDLKAMLLSLEAKVGALEIGKPTEKPAPAADEEDDENVDSHRSEDEKGSDETKRITEARLQAYHKKMAKKNKSKPEKLVEKLRCVSAQLQENR